MSEPTEDGEPIVDFVGEEDGPEESPINLRSPEHQVVVFADMLGFGAISQQSLVEPDVFEELQRPGPQEFLRASLEGMRANELSERFIRFHLLVAEATREVRLVNDGTSITFSDCAFFATDTLCAAVEYATGVLRRGLEQSIPIRIGIAYGQFLIVRIRADFGMVNQDHVVQILGSGVAAANAAERCGVKGMRILMHPTASALALDKREQPPAWSKWDRLLPLEEPESQNRVGVLQEVCWLWHPKHDDTYWKAVNEMRLRAHPDERHHYEATKAAMNRMRVSLGRPHFDDYVY